MQSQYTDDYLATNKSRGMGKGLTPGSYLSYELRGRAKSWAGRYTVGLVRSCERAGAVTGPSMKGGTAYYPKEVE